MCSPAAGMSWPGSRTAATCGSSIEGLDGGSRIAMTTRQPVPKRGQAAFSDEGKGNPGTLRTGPVFSEFQVERAFGPGKFATAVRVYHGLRRIEVTTRLVNAEKYVRYQVAVPDDDRRRQDDARDPLRRDRAPGGDRVPRAELGRSTATEGTAWRLNIGLPGNLTTDGTMMISLLRSHNLGAYGFGGGYEPGMSSESGFQIGQERTLRYALVPHAGDWREAGVFRDGLEFNHPLLCRAVLPHAGTLPARWGLLEVSNPNVVVSALKPGTRVLPSSGSTRRPDGPPRA